MEGKKKGEVRMKSWEEIESVIEGRGTERKKRVTRKNTEGGWIGGGWPDVEERRKCSSE